MFRAQIKTAFYRERLQINSPAPVKIGITSITIE
jgi:hypothetical protein